MSQRSRVFGLIFTALGILCAGCCAALFIFQRSLIYFPQPSHNQFASTLVRMKTATGTSMISSLPKTSPRALIYIGGKAEDVTERLVAVQAWNRSYSVITNIGHNSASNSADYLSLIEASH